MARLSKAPQFVIYQDSEPGDKRQSAEERGKKRETGDDLLVGKADITSVGELAYECETRSQLDAECSFDLPIVDLLDDDLDGDADDERRESVLTSASISTMPESAWHTDVEYTTSHHSPYPSPSKQAPFRRAGSVQRMRMASPASSSTSHRRSITSRTRSSTPRSVRMKMKRTPRHPINPQHDESDGQPNEKEYPLVLLHVTLLPLDLKWSSRCLKEIGPPHLCENLQLLQGKVSETMSQRGILIPHPRDDFELLEDRILEALELKEERITKCGHFRSRDSTRSISMASGSSRSNSDSGLGSCGDFSDREHCHTCQKHVKTSKRGVGSGKKVWTIKVFAANGLMRAPTWEAAWSEMERIDVEILPWVSENLRQQLDTWMESKNNDFLRPNPNERMAAGSASEARECLSYEGEMSMEDYRGIRTTEVTDRDTTPDRSIQPAVTLSITNGTTPEARSGSSGDSRASFNEVRDNCASSDIPVSLLLKNYIYLLVRDHANTAVICFCFMVLLVAIRATVMDNSALAPTGMSAWENTEVQHIPFSSVLEPRLVELRSESKNTTESSEVSAWPYEASGGMLVVQQEMCPKAGP